MLVGSQYNGLRVLGIGVGHHVGGFPTIGETTATARTVELGGLAVTDGLVFACIGNGLGEYGHGLGDFIGASASTGLHAVGHLILSR